MSTRFRLLPSHMEHDFYPHALPSWSLTLHTELKTGLIGCHACAYRTNIHFYIMQHIIFTIKRVMLNSFYRTLTIKKISDFLQINFKVGNLKKKKNISINFYGYKVHLDPIKQQNRPDH